MKQYRIVFSDEAHVYKIQISEDDGATWEFECPVSIQGTDSLGTFEMKRATSYGSFDAAEHVVKNRIIRDKKYKSDEDYTWQVIGGIYKEEEEK